LRNNKAWIDQIKAMKNKEVVAEASNSKELEEPQIQPDEIWVWEAFIALNGQRHTSDRGFPLPITVADVLAYLSLTAVSIADRHFAFQVIQALDRVYCEARFKKIEDERKKAEAQANLKNMRGGRGR
jgi:hypothetical protein